MTKFVDFKCKPGSDIGGLEDDVIEKVNLDFPEAYTSSEGMVVIAKANKESKDMTTCLLPFCHTVEAENLGGDINLGTAQIGPRCGEYVYENTEDLLNLPSYDFNKGRLAEVIKAIETLKVDGENVTVNVTGPITILNNLMSPNKIFKIWRKEPDLMTSVIEELRVEILRYIDRVIEAGADIIAYEDPIGALNILGPKFFETQGRNFSYPFIKEAIELIGDRATLHVCPKTTYQLLGLEVAQWEELELSDVMTYEEAYIKYKDKIPATGNICIHNRNLDRRDKLLKILQVN